MSLPRQLHEQLLSAYLDDALSGDECIHVEQMLARDAAVRAELQQMQRLQAETRRALAAPPPGAGERKLDDQFADRVMQAAFAEAQEAKLSEDHPLRRAATRVASSRDVSPSRSGGWGSIRGRRQVAALVALAAVLLLAVTLGQPGVDNPVDDPVVAEANGGDINGEDAEQPADPDGQYPSEPTAGLAVTEEAVDDESPTPTAADDAPAVDGKHADAASMIAAVDRPTEPSPETIASAAVTPSPAVPAADARAAMGPDRGVAAAGAAAALQLPINMVMVLQVEQTELGRTDEAVLQALRDAGIRTGIDRAIDQQVVGYLREAKMVASADEEDEGRRSSILFIEAPGKQLDRFMVSLFRRPDQIARVGLDLGMDPPLMAAASQLSQVEPSQVQHAPDTATAWRLVRGENLVDFTLPAAGRAFTPVKADMAAALSPNQGPDILGRLLMVIR